MQPLFKTFFNMKFILSILCLISINAKGQIVPQGFIIPPAYMESVTIGSQVWMKRNLDITTYRNGDAIEIANVTSGFTTSTSQGAWCYWDFNSSNNAIYGKLYNAYAVNDSRGICPVGWRVPTLTDWQILQTYVTTASVVNGGKLKDTTSYWKSPNTGATNSTGFAALPGGYIGNSSSSSYLTGRGYFWTATPSETAGTQYVLYVDYNNKNIVIEPFGLQGGVSVRCIKN